AAAAVAPALEAFAGTVRWKNLPEAVDMPLVSIFSVLLLLGATQSSSPSDDANAGTAASQPAESQPAAAVIEGIVTNSMGGGVVHAKVRLERVDAPSTLIAETSTNQTGEIALRLKQRIQEKITARVTITKDGFAPFSKEIEIDPTEDLPHIDATM